MPAAYDTYDYPSYWEGREYEHLSEELALKRLLSEIDNIGKLIDIGAGYGRLSKQYIYRSKKVVITDPSAKLLKMAKKNFDNKNTVFVQSTIDNLPKRFKVKSFDVLLMVRVIHHIDDVDKCFGIANKLLKENGYFILEFPNKGHFKAVISEISKGNVTFPLEFLPKDLRSKSAKRQKGLPFNNYHYDFIDDLLYENGFFVIDKLSVSNFRNSFIKNSLPIEMLTGIEKYIQKPLSYINFGPSLFLLSKKFEDVK
jgi:SAM-dependent methyltransferase